MSIDLAAIVEGLREKAASFKTDRQTLTNNLKQVIADAQAILTDLGESAGEVVSAARKRGRKKPGRPRGSKNKNTAAAEPAKKTKKTKKRRPMSQETKDKMAAAQKARWAAQKAAKA